MSKSLSEIVAAAKTAERPKSDPVDVAVGGELVTLVFTQMDGTEWAELVTRFPPRLEVLLDLRYGYNAIAACAEVAPLTGAQLVDGAEVQISAELWSDMFTVLSGRDVSAIADAVWALNEWNPSQKVDDLKKAFKAVSKKKPVSQES